MTWVPAIDCPCEPATAPPTDTAMALADMPIPSATANKIEQLPFITFLSTMRMVVPLHRMKSATSIDHNSPPPSRAALLPNSRSWTTEPLKIPWNRSKFRADLKVASEKICQAYCRLLSVSTPSQKSSNHSKAEYKIHYHRLLES